MSPQAVGDKCSNLNKFCSTSLAPLRSIMEAENSKLRARKKKPNGNQPQTKKNRPASIESTLSDSTSYYARLAN